MRTCVVLNMPMLMIFPGMYPGTTGVMGSGSTNFSKEYGSTLAAAHTGIAPCTMAKGVHCFRKAETSAPT